ncbi:MAG: peptidoglycan editing factor PgeF [Ferruginibacter sp.]|nr:peptidoglycan editing factor PgeF [Rhodoferax sp.]
MSDWIVPDWPAPAQVRAVFTTRAGGVSAAPYNALNLGDHVGDALADVQANRVSLADAICAKPVFLQQVHGREVAHLHGPTLEPVAADASLTTQPGVACTAMVADCLPVLFTDTRGTVVAAAHAGWRGLMGSDGQGVLESIYKEIMALTHIRPAQAATEVIAWLGPCIGPSAFEVGPEVRTAFIAQQPGAEAFFVRHGPHKWLANLPGLARLRLEALGLQGIYGNDGSPEWCTVSNRSRFFSYRRSGICGRMAACIWLQA